MIYRNIRKLMAYDHWKLHEFMYDVCIPIMYMNIYKFSIALT